MQCWLPINMRSWVTMYCPQRHVLRAAVLEVPKHFVQTRKFGHEHPARLQHPVPILQDAEDFAHIEMLANVDGDDFVCRPLWKRQAPDIHVHVGVVQVNVQIPLEPAFSAAKVQLQRFTLRITSRQFWSFFWWYRVALLLHT